MGLGFPSGVAPGFDQNHVAASGVRFSGISQGGGFVNVLNGKAGTSVGPPGTSISGVIGRGSVFTSATNNAFNFAGMQTTNDNTFTIGGILTYTTFGGFNSWFSTSSDATHGVAIGSNGSTPSNILFNFNGSTNAGSSNILVTNIPYFLIFSASLSAQSYIIKNLANGQITVLSSSTVCTYAGGAPNGTFQVGNDGTTLGAGATVAAVMYSNQKMLAPQLLQWTEDPWGFWYPQ